MVAEVRTVRTAKKKPHSHREGKAREDDASGSMAPETGGAREDMTGRDPESIHAREGKMGLVWMEKNRNLERGGIGTGQDKNK